MTNNNYPSTARLLASLAYNAQEETPHNIDPEDWYVVWFSKTLQNWKALVSTDMVSGIYIEVTRNGDKGETYVDIYSKYAQEIFKP